MRTVRVLVFLCLFAGLSSVPAADKKAPKPAADLPEIKELPNPFTFADGSPVRAMDDWQRRREELKDLFQDYMYGHMPPKPKKMTIVRGDKVTDEENKVVLQALEGKLEQDDKKLTL